MPAVVVYDANVLYPSTLRDVLIRVGLARLDRTRRLMNDAIRDVTVVGYEHLIDQLDLPDPDDRHVNALSGIVAEIAVAWGDGAGPGDVLDRLAIDAPGTVALVRQAVGDRG